MLRPAFIQSKKRPLRDYKGGKVRARRGLPHFTLSLPSLYPHFALSLPSLWCDQVHTGIRLVLDKIQVNGSHALQVYTDTKFGEQGRVSTRQKPNAGFELAELTISGKGMQRAERNIRPESFFQHETGTGWAESGKMYLKVCKDFH